MISGTKEWAVAEINCCIGCPHNCRYCYARIKALERGEIAEPGDWSSCRVMEEQVHCRYPFYDGQVMFPAAHDITWENIDSCLEVLEALLAAGNRVLVVSKPSPDCVGELCGRLAGYRERVLFRFTITARSDKILSFWEPGAPGYDSRLKSLMYAHRRGFATSVSIEPMLDADDIDALVAELLPWVSHSIWIGKMNRIERRVAVESPEIEREVARVRREQSDAGILRIYERLSGNKMIRWKESIKEVVGLPLLTEMGQDR